MAQLMPLPLTVTCFSKIQTGFDFLVPAHLGSHEKRAVKRVCVQLASMLRELQWHMGSQSVTFHPAELTFPLLPQPKLVPNLVTTEGCKAELTYVAGYVPRWYTRLKDGQPSQYKLGPA